MRDERFEIAAPRSAVQCSNPAMGVRQSDGALWIAWEVADREGPEGGILARWIAADGSPIGYERVIARGTRGEFVLGGVATLEDGGAVVAWRGDEGLAWITHLGPDGHRHHDRFLEPCVGTPAVVAGPQLDDGVVTMAWVRPDGRARLARVDARGEMIGVWEGERGGHSIAIARDDVVAVADPGMLSVFMFGAHQRVPLPSARVVPHVPSIAVDRLGAAVAWIGEDTGRLSLWLARAGTGVSRVADVWAPVDRPAWSAPSLTSHQRGLLIAWREERGPMPAVYLRVRNGTTLSADGPEVRVSRRGFRASPGRVALSVVDEETWACAYVERGSDDPSDGVYVRVGGVHAA